MASKYRGGGTKASSIVVADGAASLCLGMGLIALVLLMSSTNSSASWPQTTSLQAEKACDEIYVVGEGETLHTISDKCADPYIVERNPHIHDPDDVFPGLVIKIVPLTH
ncbi:peptidoglycan-binding LysM domain-containing protein [Perilla frutescens var. hirtella]|nr:peptidoglycan-binding LysM domain-containing protein [Perilla frutescens var. hirtella]KAH6809629.1 peptidoglycan-binding LysM domain-containing protein [Perilla frutescens var. frutescens]